MFEQEYKRANDRIHPRKDLLKEMEANWAAEQARQSEEEGKVVAFPTWAKYVSMAAGVLLCVGLGMGSMLLFSRSRGLQSKSAPAEAPQMAEGIRPEENEKIVIETANTTVDEISAADAESADMLMASVYEAPKGMHPAADEAEVEDAIRYGYTDRGEAEVEEAEPEASLAANDHDEPAATNLPKLEVKSNAKAAPAQAQVLGQVLTRDDLLAVFLPTTEQVRIVRYADNRLTSVFSLGLRERNAQVKQIFWMGSELLALREKNGHTELMRFDVSDWKSPRHLKTLDQSGTFLGAWELDGRLYSLSLYSATDEEPRPWVNGVRMDFADVLLDADRPGDVFTVLTVFDPARDDGFLTQRAILIKAKGAVAAGEQLVLWAGDKTSDLYAFAWTEDGLELAAQRTLSGRVTDALAAEDGIKFLLQNGDDVELLTGVDDTLTETASATASRAGVVRRAALDGEGEAFLTEDTLHVFTKTGDRQLEISGDGLRWLTEDRLLVFSTEGDMRLISLDGDELKPLGTVQMRDGLGSIVEDPNRMDFDPSNGRLVFPSGDRVYLYRINDAGEMIQAGSPLYFNDHNEAEQRELRCRIMPDWTLVFYKGGVLICNQILERQLTCKY